jgi:agmatinase
MYNVANLLPGVSRIVQVGIRDLCEEEIEHIRASEGGIRTFFDVSMQARKLGGESWKGLCQEIVETLPPQVYISFDIDGLDPVLCPHTGTPVAGGLSFNEAVLLLQVLVESGRRIVGFDLNEVAPGPDGDEWDGNVGARILYKLIGFTLLSQGIGSTPELP